MDGTGSAVVWMRLGAVRALKFGLEVLVLRLRGRFEKQLAGDGRPPSSSHSTRNPPIPSNTIVSTPQHRDSLRAPEHQAFRALVSGSRAAMRECAL